jgi:hypothetical protein
MNFLNQYCALALNLESLLLAPSLKVFLQQKLPGTDMQLLPKYPRWRRDGCMRGEGRTDIPAAQC